MYLMLASGYDNSGAEAFPRARDMYAGALGSGWSGPWSVCGSHSEAAPVPHVVEYAVVCFGCRRYPPCAAGNDSECDLSVSSPALRQVLPGRPNLKDDLDDLQNCRTPRRHRAAMPSSSGGVASPPRLPA